MPQVFESQNAFNAGELSPKVLGRSLIPAYKGGLRLCENMLLLTPGGMERRPGSIYVAPVHDETKVSRLIPFRFSQQEAFILELAHGAMRVFKDGAAVAHKDHVGLSTSIVAATEDELTIANHGFRDGQRVLASDGTGTLPTGLFDGGVYNILKPYTVTISAVDTVGEILTSVGHGLSTNMGPFRMESTGITPGNTDSETDYYLRSVTTDTFQISTSKGGPPVNLTSPGTGTHRLVPTDVYKRDVFRLVYGGLAVDITAPGLSGFSIGPEVSGEVFRVDHPYSEEELFDIQYAQDKDIVYLTHADHALRRIVRYADHAWQFEDFELDDGPYLDLQETFPGTVNEDITMLVDSIAVGSNRTVTASTGTFGAHDVGRAIRIGDDSDAAKWGWGRITGVGGDYVITDEDNTGDSFFYWISAWGSSTPGLSDAVFGRTWTGFPAIDYVNAGQIVTGYVYSVTGSPPLSVGDKVYIVGTGVTLTEARVYPTYLDAQLGTNVIDMTSGGSVECYTTFVGKLPTGTAHGLADLSGPVTISGGAGLPPGLSSTASYWISVWSGDVGKFSLTLTPGGEGAHMETSSYPYRPFVIYGATAVAATSATMKIEEAMPAAATSGQKAWKLGAFANHQDLGHPAAVGLHEQRLVLGGARGTPQTVYGSFSGRQRIFAPDEIDPATTPTERVITASSGYTFRLVSEDLNSIGWLRPARALFAAGLGGVFHLTGATVTDSLTPASVNARRGTTKGAANVSPMMLGSAVIFVDEAQRRLQHGEFRPDIEAIEVDDLMQLADHLSYGFTITQIARTETPLPLLWGARSDGTLICCTLEQKQNVLAWSRHLLGGTDAAVESVATLPDAQGGDLYMVVRRTINGVTRRYIEYLANRIDEIADHELFQNGDCGPLPYEGPAITTLSSGLDHLEGETLEVIADGGAHPDVVVTGGSITLDRASTKVVVGLPFSARARLLPPEIEQPGQHLAMRTVRSIEATVRLNRTLGIKIGPDLDHLTALEFRTQLGPMNEPPPLFTGLMDIAVAGGYERDGGLWLVSEQGFPCQILSVLQRIEVVQR